MTDLTHRIDVLLAQTEGLEKPLEVTRHWHGPSPEDEGEATVFATEAEWIAEQALDAFALLREARAALAAEYERGRVEEREACAKEAVRHSDAMQTIALKHPEDSDSRSRCFARARSLTALAVTIRARGETND